MRFLRFFTLDTRGRRLGPVFGTRRLPFFASKIGKETCIVELQGVKRVSVQTASFGILGALATAGAIQGGISWMNSGDFARVLERQERYVLPAIDGAGDLQGGTKQVRLTTARLLMSDTDSEREEVRGELRDQLAFVESELNDLAAEAPNEEVRGHVAELRAAWAEYLEIHRRVIDLTTQGALQEAQALYKTVGRDSFNAAQRTLDHLQEDVREYAVTTGERARERTEFAALSSVLGLLLVIAAAAGGLWFMRARVLAPLGRLQGSLERLADRQTEVQVADLGRGDEIGAMAASLERLRAVSVEAFRVEAAVADGATPILLSDADGSVTFVNAAFTATMRTRAQAMGADAYLLGDVIGRRLESVLAAAGARELAEAEGVRSTSATIGQACFDLTIWPATGRNGERLGHVVQWIDVTSERETQAAVERLVSRAAAGDFSDTLSVAEQNAFFRTLADMLNRLFDEVRSNLAEANRVMHAFAKGDLTASFGGQRQGVFAELQASANAVARQLSATVSRIEGSCSAVAAATRQISAGASDLSQRTERQASSLQETASAMEQLAATINATAQNAHHAADIAAAAEQSATQGGAVVGEATSAMRRIEEGSRRIGDITGLIEEISFQTNLLALNAAVEAARAGEAGRGFAVVAQEVRALAQRAAAASREIKELIDRSGEDVREGAALVRQAQEALGDIVKRVREVNSVIGDISNASAEQAQGVREVNVAVTDLDRITQENAALVEQTSAALASTGAQVEGLLGLMEQFKVERTPALADDGYALRRIA